MRGWEPGGGRPYCPSLDTASHVPCAFSSQHLWSHSLLFYFIIFSLLHLKPDSSLLLYCSEYMRVAWLMCVFSTFRTKSTLVQHSPPKPKPGLLPGLIARLPHFSAHSNAPGLPTRLLTWLL